MRGESQATVAGLLIESASYNKASVAGFIIADIAAF